MVDTEERKDIIDSDISNEEEDDKENSNGSIVLPPSPVQPIGGQNSANRMDGQEDLGNNARSTEEPDNNLNVSESPGSNTGGQGAGGGGTGLGSENDDDDDDESDESADTSGETSAAQPLIQNQRHRHKPGKKIREWKEKRRQKKEEKRAASEGEETKKRGKKHARKQGQNAQNLNPELVTEEMNMDVVNAALNAETIDAEDDQPGVDQNRAFDTLKDIENLKKDKKEDDYKPADGAEDEAKKLADLRLKVFKARTGNLYRAVIHARMIEKGEEPAKAEKALTKKGGKGPNRFSRFMNSSVVKGAGHLMDQAGQVGKITGGVAGVASYFDESFKLGKTNAAIGLVTSVIAAVNSIRGLIKKTVTLAKMGKNLPIKKRIFMVIGIVSDLANTVSKAAALAKIIEGFAGRGQGVLAKVADKVSTISAMVGQIGGITVQADNLHNLRKGIAEAKQVENAQAKEADKAMKRYPEEGIDARQEISAADPLAGNQENPRDVGEGGDPVDNGAILAEREAPSIETDPEEGDGAERPAKRRIGIRERRRIKKENRDKGEGGVGILEKKKFVRKAKSFLKRKDISDGDREPVALFLGFRRVRKKKTGTVKIAVSNLITTILGLGSGAAKTAFLFDENNDTAKDMSGKAGLISSVGLLGSSIANHFVKKRMGDKGRTGKQEETGAIKETLYGMMKGVADDDKYGLRKVAGSLEGAPNEESKEEAAAVLKRYEDVDKNLKGMGVNYGSLLQANNRDAFKDALIAGM